MTAPKSPRRWQPPATTDNGNAPVYAHKCERCGAQLDITTLDGALIELERGTWKRHRCPNRRPGD